jgi:hypothetical protein
MIVSGCTFSLTAKEKEYQKESSWLLNFLLKCAEASVVLSEN